MDSGWCWFLVIYTYVIYIKQFHVSCRMISNGIFCCLFRVHYLHWMCIVVHGWIIPTAKKIKPHYITPYTAFTHLLCRTEAFSTNNLAPVNAYKPLRHLMELVWLDIIRRIAKLPDNICLWVFQRLVHGSIRKIGLVKMTIGQQIWRIWNEWMGQIGILYQHPWWVNVQCKHISPHYNRYMVQGVVLSFMHPDVPIHIFLNLGYDLFGNQCYMSIPITPNKFALFK